MLLVGDGVKSRSTAYQPVSGTNKSEGHDAVIILGRDEPSVRDAEQRAMAIWYDTKKPIRRIDADLKGLVNYRTRERALNRPGIGGDRFDQITQPWGVGP